MMKEVKKAEEKIWLSLEGSQEITLRVSGQSRLEENNFKILKCDLRIFVS